MKRNRLILPGMLSVLEMMDWESRDSRLLDPVWILALRATLEISARVDSISFLWTGLEEEPGPWRTDVTCSRNVTSRWVASS